MYKVVISACLLLIAALVGLTVVGGDDADGEVDFVFNNGAEVHSFDIHRISWMGDIRIANALFEGLMAFRIEPPAPGETLGRVTTVPGVAADHPEVSNDGLVYTFRIRQDARWSNGEPVRAEDFVWSWRRLMTPQTGSDYAFLTFVIRGAKEYFDALKNWTKGQDVPAFDGVGVKATDSRTVVVELNAPTGYFLDLMAFAPFMPAHPPLLAEHRDPEAPVLNGIGMYRESWTTPGVIVSNGPYVLTGRRFKRDMLLEKNPHYWDRANVKLNRVRALVIENSNTAFKAYQSGMCDWVGSVPGGAARAIAALPREERPADYSSSHALATYYYRFNCTDTASGRANPLADPRVRRALAMCVDKQDIVTNVTGRHEPTAGSFVPPGLTVTDLAGTRYRYTSPEGLRRDVKAAKKLLAEAGYASGADLGEIRLLFNTSNDHRPIAERVASVWQRDLGIDVVLDMRDKVAFGEALKASDKPWHVARAVWYGDYADPENFLSMFATGNGNNDCGYSNTDVDAKLAAAADTGDQARRMRLLADAEGIIVGEEAAILPLYHVIGQSMVRPSVQGAWPNLMRMFLLKQISVER